MVSNKIITGENVSHYTARLTRDAIRRSGIAWTILVVITLLWTIGCAVWVLEDGEKKMEKESGDQEEEEEERERRRRKETRTRSNCNHAVGTKHSRDDGVARAAIRGEIHRA